MIRTLFPQTTVIYRNSRNCLQHRVQPLQTVAENLTDAFIVDLEKVVGEKNVSTAMAVRELHSHDESFHRGSLPDVVVQAQSVDHVSKVAQMCNQTGVPLIPFAAATGLEGGVTALKGGVSLDLNYMKDIVEVNADDFDCTVECGVTRSELNSFTRDTGLHFPIDPGADATLCGMCATSASGTNAVRYGTMKENTLNLEVVLANGTVLWTGGEGKRCRKTSAGYNLTNLFVGSEGTLGIITKALLRLHAIPEAALSAVVHFKDVQSAVDSTVEVMQLSIPIARIEFLDEVAIDAFNKFSKFGMKVAPSLFLEFHGSPDSVEQQVAVVEEVCASHGGTDFKWAKDPEERKRLWKARHDILYACRALVPNSKAYSTDVCVPISNLPEAIMKSKEMIQKAGLVGATLGHVGDGNFHCVLMQKPGAETQDGVIKEVSYALGEMALGLKGTCTGEHGIGMGKRELLEKEVGSECLATMQAIKKALDPNNILNPGKVFV